MLKELAHRLNRYKLRNRVILAYMLVSLLTSVVLSATLYQLLSGILLKHIGENSLLSLKQSATASDTLFGQINTIRSQILVERDMQNFVYAVSEDKVVTYKAALVLSRLLSVYPFIQSIELYNSKSGVYYNTLRPGVDYNPGFTEDSRELYAQTELTSFIVLPRRIEFKKGLTDVAYEVISFVFRPSSFMRTDSIVILNLDLRLIEENIMSYSASGADSTTYMLDGNGLVLANSGPSQFLADLSGHHFIDGLFGSADEGYSTQTIDGRKCLVSYTRSAVEPWYFVNVKPYDAIIGGLVSMRNIVLLSTSATFLLAMVIYIFISRGIYNPFRRMLDRLGGVPSSSSDIETLTKAVSRSIRYEDSQKTHCHGQFARELVTGVRNDALDDEMRAGLMRQYAAASYRVLLFKLDGFDELRSADSPDMLALHQFNLANTAGEVLSPLCATACAAAGPDAVAAVCCAGALPDFRDSCREITQVFRSLFRISVSAAVGCVVSSLDDVRLSYSAASSLMRHRLFENHGCILDETRVQPYLNNDASYPYEIEAEILKSLQSADGAALEEGIRSFRGVLLSTSCDNVHQYAVQFLYSLLRFADSAGIVRQMPYELVSRIAGIDTIDGIVRQLDGFARELCRACLDMLQHRNSRKHNQLVGFIKNYLSENYSNSNLSLETVAEVVGLSPEYIRKLFKHIEGVSFSHYLTDMRLTKARELLAGTDLPVMRIGEQVGLFNASYFFTLFKKAYGLTPSVFRDRQRNAGA